MPFFSGGAGSGGCTSTYEALSQGSPVVSAPGDALRGRFTLAMLRRMQLSQFIAPSVDALPALAVKVSVTPGLSG
jgi:predicted O-linked N-acetylglucosamine transferase (SPINDLY family)